MEKQRSDLKIMFRDGARPTGNDFSDLFDSYVHRTDDGFSFSSTGAKIDNFTLGNFTAAPVAGSMRFSAGEVQFFNGAIWKNVSSNDVGFKLLAQQPAAPLPDAAYFGKVGINLGPNPVALTDDFEVGLKNNVSKSRTGTAVIGGSGPAGSKAMFFHSNVRSLAVNGGNPDQNYAIAQNQDGAVFINTVTNQSIRFSTNDTPQLLIQNGRLVVGNTAALAPIPTPPLIDPLEPIVLHVHGHAIKKNGGPNWLVTSDIRTKKDISPFKDGLDLVKELKVVNFTYNGKGGTAENDSQVGLIGQEVEKIAPYMVKRLGNNSYESDGIEYPEDMVLLDSSPLVFLLVNAVRELDHKLETLKSQQQ